MKERWRRSLLFKSSRFGPGVRPGTEGSARHKAPYYGAKMLNLWKVRELVDKAWVSPCCVMSILCFLCVQNVPVSKRHVPKTLTSRHSNKLACPNATHDFNPTLVVIWSLECVVGVMFVFLPPRSDTFCSPVWFGSKLFVKFVRYCELTHVANKLVS